MNPDASIMGVDFCGDEGCSVSAEEEEDEGDAGQKGGQEGEVTRIDFMTNSLTNSRTGTLTDFVDGVSNGGIVIIDPEEVGVTPVPPLQSTKGIFLECPSFLGTPLAVAVHARFIVAPTAGSAVINSATA